MTLTQADIYNLTLEHLGVDPNIESITEDTKKARVLNSVWKVSRMTCLKKHDWGCAKEFFTLVEVGTKPSSWAVQYKWPNDMLKPRFIENANRRADRLPYTTASYKDDENGRIKTILTDVSNAIMVGTLDLEEPALMSVELAETIAAYMAWRTARQFTDSKTIQNQMYELYQRTLADGAQVDALTDADDPEQEAPWIRGRGTDVEPLPEVIRT